jgi:hypothetical protein
LKSVVLLAGLASDCSFFFFFCYADGSLFFHFGGCLGWRDRLMLFGAVKQPPGDSIILDGTCC